MRITIAAAACLGLAGLSLAAESNAAAERFALNIPRQSLDTALKDFAQQTGLQVGRFTDAATGDAIVGPLTGTYSIDQAFERLLAASGLTYRPLNDRAYIVLTSAESSRQTKSTPPELRRNDKDGFWRRFRLTLASPAEGGGAESASVTTSSNQPAQDVGVEEVVVTAQKREERLKDVPVPVTAVAAESLVNNNQLRLQDYADRVPGLTVTPAQQSSQFLSIRGVTTGTFNNPTVGIMIDDVPYSPSTQNGGGGTVPDIDPGDLARIEVLRGPQGTLYGASSLGGLVKFVTLDPSTDRLSGRVQVGASSIAHGSGLGYQLRGSMNVPLGDTFALRASGFTRQDPGYIDDPTHGLRDVDDNEASGGRISALWKPSDTISLKLSAMAQKVEGDASQGAQPELGDLQQNNVPGTGGFTRKAQAYNAVLTVDLGSAELISLTGYNINSIEDSFDYSYALGGLLSEGIPGLLTGYGFGGAPVVNDISSDKFNQEIRLTGTWGPRLDWLVGGFYTHEDSDFGQLVTVADPTTGAFVANAGSVDIPNTYKEYALFADVTYHFNDRFDVQIGGRESRIEQTFSQNIRGALTPLLSGGLPDPALFPQSSTDASAFTYLLTPRLKLTPDLMAYARLASGYRAGGPNLSPGGIVPPKYDPDETKTYEVGFKGDFLNRAFSVDASVYYIDWTAIQIYAINPTTNLSYQFNGGRAKSQGVELSVSAHPATGLSITAWGAWNDAKLTEALANGASQSGDRLPFTSRFSGNVAVEQEFPLAGSVTGQIGGSLSYVGNRLPAIGSPGPQNYPSYFKTDVRLGLRYDSWFANLFVNNVADRRGVASGALNYFYYIQPRTVGLSLLKNF